MNKVLFPLQGIKDIVVSLLSGSMVNIYLHRKYRLLLYISIQNPEPPFPSATFLYLFILLGVCVSCANKETNNRPFKLLLFYLVSVFPLVTSCLTKDFKYYA